MAQDLRGDAGKLSLTWHNTLGKMIAEAKMSGDKAMERFLVAAKQSVDANEQADIVEPLGETGRKSGERGPEDVSVIPSNMRGAGSRSSGTNLEVHYHIGNISTLDARSMRQVVTSELVPLTIAELRRASANGQPILHSRGLINR